MRLVHASHRTLRAATIEGTALGYGGRQCPLDRCCRALGRQPTGAFAPVGGFRRPRHARCELLDSDDLHPSLDAQTSSAGVGGPGPAGPKPPIGSREYAGRSPDPHVARRPRGRQRVSDGDPAEPVAGRRGHGGHGCDAHRQRAQGRRKPAGANGKRAPTRGASAPRKRRAISSARRRSPGSRDLHDRSGRACRQLECRRRANQRLPSRRDHRSELLVLLSSGRHRARAAEGGPREDCRDRSARGRRDARAQGWVAISGERHPCGVAR